MLFKQEKEELIPYLLEAGIDLDRFIKDHKLVMEELMMYHVINKRRLQKIDMGKGMWSLCFYHMNKTAGVLPQCSI